MQRFIYFILICSFSFYLSCEKTSSDTKNEKEKLLLRDVFSNILGVDNDQYLLHPMKCPDFPEKPSKRYVWLRISTYVSFTDNWMKHLDDSGVKVPEIHVYVASGCLNFVKYFVENNDITVLKDRIGSTGAGLTPLHTAIYKGYYDIVQYLLEKGADTKATTSAYVLGSDSVANGKSFNINITESKASLSNNDSTVKDVKIINADALLFAELNHQEEIANLIRAYSEWKWWEFWKEWPDRELLESKIEKRGNLLYVKNEKSPYTGKLFENHPNGQRRWECTFKDGKRSGDNIIRDENGRVTSRY